MKRITLLFAATLFMVSASFAGERTNAETWAWSVNAGRLTRCLGLKSNQYDNVATACEYFSNSLLKAARSNDEVSRSTLIRKAVGGNLKMMKSALDKEQYRKYVRLMNVTLRNKGLDVYLD